jgi:hypothetical protein
MSIDFWILLWKIVLIAGVTLFALLAICVSIGGFFDVKRLLVVLRQQHAEQETSQGQKSDRST